VARRWVAYRLRRALLDEHWPFRLYLSYFARTALGLVAITLLIGIAPLIVWSADEGLARWSVALLLAALLGLWHLRYTRVMLWLWRATPLADLEHDAGLNAACASVLARATTVPTRIWHAGPGGSVIANAVALPGLHDAHIVISRTLIERLSINEIA